MKRLLSRYAPSPSLFGRGTTPSLRGGPCSVSWVRLSLFFAVEKRHVA